MGWINKIATGINTVMKEARPVLNMGIPALLLLCEIGRRPGLSAIALSSAIIQRLPEYGIETGVNPDGSPNKINGFIKIFCEELVKEIKMNSLVTVGVQQSGLNIVGQGANAGGPVTVTSTNINPILLKGIVS